MRQGLFGSYQEGASATFLSGARSLLILVDVNGRPWLQSLVDAATERGIPITDFALCRDTAATDVDRAGSFLRDQPMGTRVGVAVDAVTMAMLEPVLQLIGLTDEEVWLASEGSESHPVFCSACYFQNPPTHEPFIRCAQCSRILEVSDHYSPRLRAVMGYVSLPEQRPRAVGLSASKQTDD